MSFESQVEPHLNEGRWPSFLKPHGTGVNVPPRPNPARIAWDLKRMATVDYDAFWKKGEQRPIPPEIFARTEPVWLEVGAGSGWFFVELARHFPQNFLVAIERSKMRGSRLVKRAARSELTNLAAFKGNAIPALINSVPSQSVDRLYLLYPCPWPKTAQRKNRWYLHPVMRHFARILKPGGLMIWASDQRFFIDEAEFACREFFGCDTLSHGLLAPNSWNHLDIFPEGRTYFERSFLRENQACFEVIVTKR